MEQLSLDYFLYPSALSLMICILRRTNLNRTLTHYLIQFWFLADSLKLWNIGHHKEFSAFMHSMWSNFWDIQSQQVFYFLCKWAVKDKLYRAEAPRYHTKVTEYICTLCIWTTECCRNVERKEGVASRWRFWQRNMWWNLRKCFLGAQNCWRCENICVFMGAVIIEVSVKKVHLLCDKVVEGGWLLPIDQSDEQHVFGWNTADWLLWSSTWRIWVLYMVFQVQEL